MKKIFLILFLISCSSVAHKPTEVINLDEAIQRVEADEAIPQDKKNYYADKLKSAKSSLENQAVYITQLETENSGLRKSIEDLKNEIVKLSESKGRIKQLDFQFWGFIGLIVLGLIGMILYIIIKYGKNFTPAGATSSIASGILKL